MYDLIFKLIFAKDMRLLRPLLKSIANLSDEELEGIVVIDPHTYPEGKGGKIGVMDIKVLFRSKKIVDVEMQRKKFAHLRERIVSYFSGMVKDQIGSGDDYGSLKRVITITITGHVLIDGDNEYHHRYTLYDPKTGSEFTDLIEVHTLELPKLPKTDDGSDLWWWMKYIMVERKEQLKMIAERGPVMERAAARLIEISEGRRTPDSREFIRCFSRSCRTPSTTCRRLSPGNAGRKGKRPKGSRLQQFSDRSRSGRNAR